MIVKNIRQSPQLITNGLVFWLEALDFGNSVWPDRTLRHSPGVVSGPTKGSNFVLSNSVADVVTFPHSPDWNFGGDFTISIWINGPSVNDKFMMGHADTEDSAHGWIIKISNGRYGIIGVEGGEWDSGISFLDSTWHNMVATRNGNTLYLYKDGVSSASTGMSAGPVFNTDSLRICRGGSNTNFGLVGKYGSVLIYNRSLSPAEIASNYTNSKSFFGV